MELHQLAGDSKAQSETLLRASALHEWFEHPVQQFGRDPLAAVSDGQDGFAPLFLERHLNRAAGPRVRDRIRNQVRDHLLKTQRVRVDQQRLGGHADREVLVPGPGLRRDRVHDLPRRLPHVDAADVQRRLVRSEQRDLGEVVYETAEPVKLSIDDRGRKRAAILVVCGADDVECRERR
jgi:hypothetical protein